MTFTFDHSCRSLEEDSKWHCQSYLCGSSVVIRLFFHEFSHLRFPHPAEAWFPARTSPVWSQLKSLHSVNAWPETKQHGEWQQPMHEISFTDSTRRNTGLILSLKLGHCRRELPRNSHQKVAGVQDQCSAKSFHPEGATEQMFLIYFYRVEIWWITWKFTCLYLKGHRQDLRLQILTYSTGWVQPPPKIPQWSFALLREYASSKIFSWPQTATWLLDPKTRLATAAWWRKRHESLGPWTIPILKCYKKTASSHPFRVIKSTSKIIQMQWKPKGLYSISWNIVIPHELGALQQSRWLSTPHEVQTSPEATLAEGTTCVLDHPPPSPPQTPPPDTHYHHHHFIPT